MEFINLLKVISKSRYETIIIKYKIQAQFRGKQGIFEKLGDIK